MCVGCREMKNKKELTRVVRTPQGSIEIDNSGKKPGRGAYLCPQLDCLQQALKGKRLQKALEQEIPAEVVEMLTNQISKSFP